MSYRLWLDDVRPLPSVEEDWRLAVSLWEFKRLIELFGLPYYISFDHDLGEGGTGMECARWLVDKGYTIPEYDVHSANPVGTENIWGLLENYKQFCLREKAEKSVLAILEELGDRGGFKFDEVWKECPRKTQQEMMRLWTNIVHNTMKFEIEKAVQPFQELIRR